MNKKFDLAEHISPSFPHIEKIVDQFRKTEFLNLSYRKRFRQINETLYQLIKEAPPQSFLLRPALDYVARINREKLLPEPYDFSMFEFWLNHFSGLSDQDNFETRGKIAGKYIPREEYQPFFPIGMGKTYKGTHFVTAHLSPDVDTMIASFWGWIDAFGARVGTGLHRWCLPGGPPDSPITTAFSQFFGSDFFQNLARTTSSITLQARDLVSQKEFFKEKVSTLASAIEQSTAERATILVDEQGHYLGDWRSSDAEAVRPLIMLFKSCLHWFEKNLHSHLIALFAKKDLSVKDLSSFQTAIFDTSIQECEAVQEFNESQLKALEDLFTKVLGLKKGIHGTFRELFEILHIVEMVKFHKKIEHLSSTDLFENNGHLREDRSKIFNVLNELIKDLDEALFAVRNHIERLAILMDIKHKVLNSPQVYLTMKSDVEEMQQKMENFDFLTVVIHEQDNSLFPIGVVREKDLRDKGLGTVTFRDFSNFDEVKMAPYLEVISIVDHHKTSLKTPSVPTALIGDAQSCNVLIAEQNFAINDKFGQGGLAPPVIDTQIQEISSPLTSIGQMRILKRLLQRKLTVEQNMPFFVHPAREFCEYTSFLHAILDDTDLLSKVSHRDLECVVQLLNRLKSLSEGKEMEIIHLDDLPKDKNFTKNAAKRILQHADMYAFYKAIYAIREKEADVHLELCTKGEPSSIFVDVKEQNGCARVGQTKLFASNYPLFLKYAPNIRQIWLNKSSEVFQNKPEIDLHLHMISTIPSAEEVYKGQIGPYHHWDELWIWVPATQQATQHLNHFLSGFRQGLKHSSDQLSLEWVSSPSKDFKTIVTNHFPEVPQNQSKENSKEAMCILRFRPGLLNSRKSMVSPFLPHPL